MFAIFACGLAGVIPRSEVHMMECTNDDVDSLTIDDSITLLLRASMPRQLLARLPPESNVSRHFQVAGFR